MSSSGLYNVLHLHTEKQWVEQCGHWEQSQNGGCGACCLLVVDIFQAACDTSPWCRIAACQMSPSGPTSGRMPCTLTLQPLGVLCPATAQQATGWITV